MSGAVAAAGEPIAPGVSDIRHITLCISIGPRSASSTSTSISVCADVRVLDDVLGVVDRGDRGAGLGEGGDDLVPGALGDPAADVLVEQVGVLGPGAAGGEPRLVDDLG